MTAVIAASATAPADARQIEAAVKALTTIWLSEKDKEDTAKAARLSAEKDICDLLTPTSKECTLKPISGLSVKYGISRTVDSESLFAAWNSLTPTAQSVFKMKAEVDKRAFDAALAMNPDVVGQVSTYITTKDSKPSFSFTAPKE